MDNKQFTKRLNRLTEEIKNFKMNQTIGGDSWVVYRTKLTFTSWSDGEYKIRFSPEVSSDFTAVVVDENGTTTDYYPDQSIKGVWWRGKLSTGHGSVTRTIMCFSTVKGELSVQDVTGLGPI